MNDRHCIEVQWTVEGLREFAKERNAFLAQCNVVVYCVPKNFEWEICLRMKDGKLKVCLANYVGPVVESQAVTWSACLVTADGERWKSGPWQNDYITLATCEELLDDEKGLIFKGIARLSVQIFATASYLNHTCTLFARSKVGVSREITWKVEDFSSIGSSTDDDKKWLYLLKKLSGDEEEVELEMRLFLQAEEPSLCIGVYPRVEIEAWYSSYVIMEEVSIMRFDGSKEECWKRKETNADVPRDSTIAFIEKQKLMDDKQNLLPEDVLTLFVKFSDFNNFSICNAGEMVEGVNPAFPTLSPDQSMSSLSHDMEVFLESGAHSDFTLRVGSEEFPVLKGVLCARSPVFRAMFGSPAWLEAERKSLDVPDFGPDAVRLMVRYIYTDRVPERMDPAAAAELYAAADKYALLGLRAHCARQLTHDLRVDTACAALRLAERHSDADLKAWVRAYMSAHQRVVFLSPEWAGLMKDDPQLALEVEHELHLKKFKST